MKDAVHHPDPTENTPTFGGPKDCLARFGFQPIEKLRCYRNTNSAPITLDQAQSLLSGHDWKTERDYERELEAAEKDWCPAGIGFVTDTNHTLHICRGPEGAADCFFLELGLSPGVRGSWVRHNVSPDEQSRLLELHFRGDYASLVEGFDPPVQLAYWVQRANSTYRPDAGAVTLKKAQSLLRNFDWKAELAYKGELEAVGKAWCLPTIGFTGAVGSLLFEPDNQPDSRCYFWNSDKSCSWGCDGVTPIPMSSLRQRHSRRNYGEKRPSSTNSIASEPARAGRLTGWFRVLPAVVWRL